MTRINTIQSNELSDQLLNAEIGEIGRILYSVCERIDKGKEFNDIPEEFTLGIGHMKFFYDKCEFIMNRYMSLRNEYIERTGKHYSMQHLTEMTNRMLKIRRLRDDLWNGWTITPKAIESCLKRILERSESYSKHTYYGKEITNWKNFLYEN